MFDRNGLQACRIRLAEASTSLLMRCPSGSSSLRGSRGVGTLLPTSFVAAACPAVDEEVGAAAEQLAAMPEAEVGCDDVFAVEVALRLTTARSQSKCFQNSSHSPALKTHQGRISEIASSEHESVAAPQSPRTQSVSFSRLARRQSPPRGPSNGLPADL